MSLLGINSVEVPRALRLSVWDRMATDLRPAGLADIVAAEVTLEELPGRFQGYLDAGVRGRTLVKIN